MSADHQLTSKLKNFIIFFDEKEGTSPLVRILDNINHVSLVHQVENTGWEPFDAHNCGNMSLDNLRRCLEIIYSDRDMARLNSIYQQTGTRALENINLHGSVGFKMRFIAPDGVTTAHDFSKMMIELLSRLGIVVFIAVRQDVLRWSLSKYHGDGTGKPGHLQFKLASGEINRDQIGKIIVDCDRLQQFVDKSLQAHKRKRELMKRLVKAGVPTYPLLYEDFLQDKESYFQGMLSKLDVSVTTTDVANAMEHGAYFEKVHSDRISEFVENHAEVERRFCDQFVTW